MADGYGVAAHVPRILMFEDSEETMGGLRDYLVQRHGWSVDLTADDSLPERLGVERYDLILLDVMIHTKPQGEGGDVRQNVSYSDVPWRMTGLQFLRRLRRGDFSGPAGASRDLPVGTPKDVPVIILSAALTSSVKGQLEQDQDVQGIFEKPFILSELMETIRKALAGAPA